ncbi:MAG TPA: TOBE domain-containing protein, partial [Nitrososphaerales archaeon]|nr:TOBE domain-containing protein [Nitrososphaerales archaeon]
LNQIAEKSSITAAAKEIGISYRNAWDRLRTLQDKMGAQLVDAKAGGKEGGGATITEEGKSLVLEYKHLNDYLLSTLDDKDFWQHIGYRLSARNRIRAKILEVKSGPITSEVRMEIRVPGRLASIISNEAVQDLRLQEGDEVEAIVKATEVVIAKPESAFRDKKQGIG